MKTSYHSLIREQSGVPVDYIPDTTTEAEVKDQLKYSLHIDWLQREVTKEMFKQLSQQIDELENRARDLACTYHQQTNPHEMINCLVRASELRKIKETYGHVN
jgi:hypothetical protein